jgi:hypothetical protein
MDRSQIFLLIVSWLTIASAGFVAGHASEANQRLPVANEAGPTDGQAPPAVGCVSAAETAGLTVSRFRG